MNTPSPAFNCFGLVVHGIDKHQLLTRVTDAVQRNETTWIVTANPEILLEAKENPRYWEALRHAHVRIVDGFGLQLVGWLFGATPKRLSGVDAAEALLQGAVEKEWTVVLLGGAEGIADRAAWAMREKYPSLHIQSRYGGRVDEEGRSERMDLGKADILLVAFGHPKQEAWIYRNLQELREVKVVMGVGGTFDYWAGAIARAPQLFQKLGLEWLWRLILQPMRITRILRAVVVFPIAAILEKIKNR